MPSGQSFAAVCDRRVHAFHNGVLRDLLELSLKALSGVILASTVVTALTAASGAVARSARIRVVPAKAAIRSSTSRPSAIGRIEGKWRWRGAHIVRSFVPCVTCIVTGMYTIRRRRSVEFWTPMRLVFPVIVLGIEVSHWEAVKVRLLDYDGKGRRARRYEWPLSQTEFPAILPAQYIPFRPPVRISLCHSFIVDCLPVTKRFKVTNRFRLHPSIERKRANVPLTPLDIPSDSLSHVPRARMTETPTTR